MNKKWNASTRIIISIVATTILIIGMVGLLIWFNRFDDLQNNFIFMHIMFAILGVLNTVVIFILFYKVDKQNPWLLGFYFRKKDILFAIAATIISFLTVLSFIWFLDYKEIIVADYQFDRIFTVSFYKLLAVASIGWFFAALKEEVLARGYFMANLNHLTIPKALLISALLFMAIHFTMGDLDPYKAASWFIGGIVYAYIYIKSGSLTVSTVVHAAHNLVNDLVIHGSTGALVLLNLKITTADKLIYEVVLGSFLLLLTYLFYGKNGLFTPSDNLKLLWNKDKLPKGVH